MSMQNLAICIEVMAEIISAKPQYTEAYEMIVEQSGQPESIYASIDKEGVAEMRVEIEKLEVAHTAEDRKDFPDAAFKVWAYLESITRDFSIL